MLPNATKVPGLSKKYRPVIVKFTPPASLMTDGSIVSIAFESSALGGTPQSLKKTVQITYLDNLVRPIARCTRSSRCKSCPPSTSRTTVSWSTPRTLLLHRTRQSCTRWLGPATHRCTTLAIPHLSPSQSTAWSRTTLTHLEYKRQFWNTTLESKRVNRNKV